MEFLSFTPGLVGGHCIGVDPYYLTHKAQALGYNPEIILAGRRMNDSMSIHVVSKFVKEMIKKRIQINGSIILVMGLTFKENCPDLRNTRVFDVISELRDYGWVVDVEDPWVNSHEALEKFGLKLIANPSENTYDGIIIAVAHDEFKKMGVEAIRKRGKNQHLLYDLKYL